MTPLTSKNTPRVASRLDSDDLTLSKVIDNRGVHRETFLVSEAGLYGVIIRSDKPEAKAFRRWVTSEVLPSIRKHGMYATPTTIEEMIANPDIIIQLATTLKEERAARTKAEAEVEAQRPVAALGRAIETAEGDLTPSAFGKIIPMQDAVNRGILILTERIDKAGKIRPQLLVTPAGQSYFAGILSA